MIFNKNRVAGAGVPYLFNNINFPTPQNVQIGYGFIIRYR